MGETRKSFIESMTRYFNGRKIYLWGARQDGLSMCRVLERLGYAPMGFIDNSISLQGKSVLNYPVYAPEEILAEDDPKPYIVITSPFFADEISEQCISAGLKRKENFITHAEIQLFDYQIDISGLCNLRCISCPQGNFGRKPKSGFMSASTFEKVLTKILNEDPFVGAVSLYNWGEPLLNPNLPEIIRIANAKNIHTAISSNLNIEKNFVDVIKAHPTWFRVSVSGFGPSYEITHTGGSWVLFHRNLHLLKELKDKYHPELQVEVFYHIYRHNNGEDFQKMRKLCDDLGFTFRFRHAALAPLENIEAVIDKRMLSSEAERTRELQIFPVEEVMEIARSQKDRPCFYKRFLWITWNLRVAQCMEWFTPELSLVPGDFLTTPLSEIIAARKNNDFCQRCQEKAIHRCYVVYGDEKFIHERGSVKL
jgi:MoaA/NifB/PqqE/SkfB family radical SAM enzyme